ncbi:MAG TPA: hypothetical protein VK447_11300 [Myxococcaceae bacterium]|nr:hypothetical protein [Myxococcaceae bacterium]
MKTKLLPWLALCAATLSACAVGIGQPCSQERACPRGLVCSFPTVGGAPAANGVCDYPLRPEGEPCTVAAECETALTCSNHFEPGGRYGVCTPKRAGGEACFVNRDCTSNRCTGASGTEVDGTCAP